MKLSALALALFASIMTSQSANAQRAMDRTPVVAMLSGNQEGIQDVALLQDGRVQVVRKGKPVQSVTLSKPAREHLLLLATFISTAAVDETHSAAVCTMMAPPSLSNLKVSGYDHGTAKFDSKLRLLLTATGCWVSQRVIPQAEEHARAAFELRGALATLGLDSLKNPVTSRPPPGVSR